jgi:hypothetical protein
VSVRDQVFIIARHTIIKQKRPGRVIILIRKMEEFPKHRRKKKRNSHTSDNEYSFEEINMKPKVDAKRALNFHGYIYTNQIVSGSSKDLNHDLLDKFNQNYIQDRTHDGGAQSFMGVCHSDSNLEVALEGVSKFKRRRDYMETMASR